MFYSLSNSFYREMKEKAEEEIDREYKTGRVIDMGRSEFIWQ